MRKFLMNNERLEYLKSYFASEELVKVQVVIKGSISKYFEGQRYGYTFRDGHAMVQRKDLHYFREHYPDWIIYDTQQDDMKGSAE